MEFTDELRAAMMEIESAKYDEPKPSNNLFFDKVIKDVGLTGMAKQVMLQSTPWAIDITIRRPPISAFADHKVLNSIERKLSEAWGVEVFLISRAK